MKFKCSKEKIRNFISNIIKRTIDIIAGIIGTILLVPITIIVWFVRLKNKENGSIFFNQYRIGKNGEVFKLHKFRSMVTGADTMLGQYLNENPNKAQEYKINKKLKDDPRVTKTGKFLRDSSLDEWPQFFDVLIGKMSLVGPRPYLPAEKKDMGEYYERIVQMKPGLTGPWQVAGRSNIVFEDRLKIDDEYYNSRGNRRDIAIIFKTIMIVIKKEGAL